MGACSPDHRNGILHLLKWAREGDADALDQLLTRTYAGVVDFLRRRSRDGVLRDLEEDVAIDTVVRAATQLNSCRAVTSAQYWKWVLTIARREALRTIRGTYFTRADILAPAALEQLACSREGEAPNAKSASGPLLPLLEAVVADLPEPRKELLGLRFVEGLEYREIAHEIGTTEAAAKRRVQRLLVTLGTRLRSAVETYAGPDRDAVRAAFDLVSRER